MSRWAGGTLAVVGAIALGVAGCSDDGAAPDATTSAPRGELPTRVLRESSAGVRHASAARGEQAQPDLAGLRDDIRRLTDEVAALTGEISSLRNTPHSPANATARDAISLAERDVATVWEGRPTALQVISRWHDDVQVRENWLFLTMRGARQKFGTPTHVGATEGVVEWTYDVGDAKYVLTFADGVLIAVRPPGW